jgi:hypothetical protein
LNPLDDLRHCDEIDIIVIGEHFIDPVEEGLKEFGIIFEPSGVEVQSKGCAILVIMTLKVVIKEGIELITYA